MRVGQITPAFSSPKVRVADTISLNGLDLSAHEFTYGLDFVVMDREYLPLFSVEYDGRQHTVDGKQVPTLFWWNTAFAKNRTTRYYASIRGI